MPFTIAHAAAVLPVRNVAPRLPLAALMIGTMSPDFAYFLPTGLDRASSHDLEGIFQFCLPVGLLLWLSFVHLLERPTIELLPEAWRARVPRSDRDFSWSTLVFAGLAVVIGALTHVAWDAFTHVGTPMTEAIPALNAPLFEMRGRPVRVYRLLQYLSSVIGLLALARWAWNLRRAPLQPQATRRPSPLSDRGRMLAILFLVMASGAQALFNYVSNLHGPFEARIFHTLIGGMTGWALAWLAVALWIDARARARG
jgi:hypothetical protein